MFCSVRSVVSVLFCSVRSVSILFFRSDSILLTSSHNNIGNKGGSGKEGNIVNKGRSGSPGNKGGKPSLKCPFSDQQHRVYRYSLKASYFNNIALWSDRNVRYLNCKLTCATGAMLVTSIEGSVYGSYTVNGHIRGILPHNDRYM